MSQDADHSDILRHLHRDYFDYIPGRTYIRKTLLVSFIMLLAMLFLGLYGLVADGLQEILMVSFEFVSAVLYAVIFAQLYRRFTREVSSRARRRTDQDQGRQARPDRQETDLLDQLHPRGRGDLRRKALQGVAHERRRQRQGPQGPEDGDEGDRGRPAEGCLSRNRLLSKTT